MKHLTFSRNRKTSYYKNIVFYFTAICLFIIFISVTVLGGFFFSQIKQNVLLYNEQLLNVAKNSISQILDQVYGAAAQLSISRLVTNNFVKDTPVDYDQIGLLLSTLSELVSANSHTDSVYVVYPHHNMVVSSAGVYDYNTFHDKTWLDVANSSETNPLWMGCHRITKDKLTKISTDVISLIYKLPFYRQDICGYIVYNIKEEYFSTLLNRLDGKDNAIVLMDKNFELISSSSQSIDLDQIFKIRNTFIPNEHQLIECTSIFNGDLLFYTFIPNHIDDWIFIGISSMSNIITSVLTTLAFVFVVCILLTCSAVFYARYAAKRIYAPVAKLVSSTQGKIFNSRSVCDNNYDEFFQIDQHMNKIIKRNEQLVEACHELLPFWRDKFFLGLLYGQIRYNSTIDRYIEYLDVKLSEILYYIVILICPDQYAEFVETHNCEQQMICLLKIEEVAQSIVSAHHCFGHIVELPTHPIALILGLNADDISTVHEQSFNICNDISFHAKEHLPFSLSYYIGAPVSSLESLQDSFSQAQEARDYGFLYGNSQIVFYYNVESINNNIINPISYQKKLLNALRVGEVDDIDKVLLEIRQKLFDNHYSIINVQRFFYATTSIVMLACEELNSSIAHAQIDEWQLIFNQIYKFTTFDSIYSCVRSLYLQIGQSFSNCRIDKIRKTSNDILNYIRNNYWRDISLSDISSAMLYTPVSINRILRQTTQKTFYDILTDIRMEKASDLLINSELLVGEISEQVGYINVQSFIRMFKKITGVTPGKYREAHKTT